jgi:NAD(P)H-dependent FMN reductase
MAIKILGVSGSLRDTSYSRRAVEAALEFARAHGAETRLLDLRVTELPLYRPGSHPASPALDEATAQVTWADAFVLGSPDYHGSLSGALKNFLDYFWDEFAGKLFGHICASHEKGLTVMEQMRTSVRQCYGWSLPYGVSVHGENDFDVNGAIVNPKLLTRLKMLARDLCVYGAVIHGQFQQDLAGTDADTFVARYR